MAPKLTFCEECRDDVEYTVSEVAAIGKIKGNEYHYTEKEARCNQCNALVYIPEIIDSNLDALYASYYRENGVAPFGLGNSSNEKNTTNKAPDLFYSENNKNYLLGIMADVKSGKAVFREHELIEDEE